MKDKYRNQLKQKITMKTIETSKKNLVFSNLIIAILKAFQLSPRENVAINIVDYSIRITSDYRNHRDEGFERETRSITVLNNGESFCIHREMSSADDVMHRCIHVRDVDSVEESIKWLTLSIPNIGYFNVDSKILNIEMVKMFQNAFTCEGNHKWYKLEFKINYVELNYAIWFVDGLKIVDHRIDFRYSDEDKIFLQSLVENAIIE